MARNYRAEYARRQERAQAAGERSYAAQRAIKETRTAQENQFASRAEWRTFRHEHQQALRDLRRGDTANAWASYEGAKNPNANVRRATEFAEMRSRIARIKSSHAKRWQGEYGPTRKQATINAIMHDYVREWHDDLDTYDQEHLVWDNEGDTP